jgi:hypothetical protein
MLFARPDDSGRTGSRIYRDEENKEFEFLNIIKVRIP